MKRVLVVDDEKLVRQGIMTTFPWQKHGFVVAGDASSGEKALELLEREPFDLLVTDLAMNGMSGLELIQRTRQTHGDLPVVILTCHDNFKYIQEAMRHGVLDYIIKTEIEDEVVDETLMRIARRLKNIDQQPKTGDYDLAAEGPAEDGLLLCGPSKSSRAVDLLDPDVRESWGGAFQEIDPAAWLVRATVGQADRLASRLMPVLQSGEWTCVRITGIGEVDEQEASATLKAFRRRVLFYRSMEPFSQCTWEEIADAQPIDPSVVSRLRDQWNMTDWIHDDGQFEALIHKTPEAGIEAAELHRLFYPVVLEWERLLNTGKLRTFLERSDEWLYWREWVAWLDSFRQEIRNTVEKNANRQLGEAVFRAIERMRNEDMTDANEEEIAKSVNMSRGYFSKSFKKVTGKSYGEYVRLMKLERAKELLLRTDEPITRVAEQCGFSDYRHFSRVFREHTGKLPTDYRKTGAPH